MNASRMKSARLCLLAALSLSLVAGCGGTDKRQFGEAADPNAAKVTLSELVAKPEAYEGKDVVVNGIFAGACGDGDFFFKDKFDLIEADPPDPKVCSLKRGTPIRLYGLVKVRRKSAGEAAAERIGEAAERKEAGGKAEESEVSVRIAAKGVEVLK